MPITPHQVTRINRHHNPAVVKLARTVLACCVWLCASGGVAASANGLAEYREQVQSAVADLDQVVWSLSMEDESGADEDEIDAPGLLREVGEHLPATEQVEWDGGAVTIDNRWLHAELERYEKLPGETTSDERAWALIVIANRLRALDDRLAEAAGAPKMPRDKEVDKGRLQSILRRAEYNKQASGGGALKSFWEWLRKVLDSFQPEAQPLEPRTARGVSAVARYFVYALGLAVIALVLWFYAPRFFRRDLARRKTASEPRVVLGERLAPDQTGADLLAEAEHLARGGDWRGAVRKAYIAVLCELGDRQILRLAQHKTNRDYLGALQRERAMLYGEMHPLTANYERLWYGLTLADESDWAAFRARCRNILAKE